MCAYGRREGQDGEVEGLQARCKGSSLVLEPPPVREKSPELIARLARRQRAEDQRKYDAMVHDITHHVSSLPFLHASAPAGSGRQFFP